MFQRLEERIRDLILSFYLYNEYRGFEQLERLIRALEDLKPDEKELIAAIRKHAGDEKKHYHLFCQYFAHEKRVPFGVGRWSSYFDVFARVVIGKWTENLTENALANDSTLFAKLCRVVICTERRGLIQVESFLRSPLVSRHPHLKQIFSVIRNDEPSHYLPYEGWLLARNEKMPSFNDRFWEVVCHYGIAAFIFPLYFFNPFTARQPQMLLRG